MLPIHCTQQSRFSDIKFSDNLWFSDYFQRPFFNLLHKIIRFSDIRGHSITTWTSPLDLVTVYAETKSVT